MSTRQSFRTYHGIWFFALRVVDALAIGGAALVGHWLIHPHQPLYSVERLSIVAALLIYILIADRLQLYQPWRGRRASHELRLVAAAIAGMALTISTLHLLVVSGRSQLALLSWVGAWAGMALLVQCATRLLTHSALYWIQSKDWHHHRVALVGFGPAGAAAVNTLERHPYLGLKFVGYFDDRELPRNGFLTAASRLGKIAEMERVIDSQRIDQVWIAYPFRAEHRTAEVLSRLRHSTVNVRYLLDVFAFNQTEKPLSDVVGIPMMDLEVTPMEGVNRYVKAIEDRSVALLLLVLFSPLMLLIAFGVKLSSPGPVFYRQERVSWNNKRFSMLKFRSMPTNVESASGPRWASAGEQRATPFGALLRKTSLDELPQLLNVLRGDMSIVGPRPERPHFVETFKDQIPDYMKKHMVKAGITGWAQVNGWRGDSDLNKRIECDLFYIQHWSLLFDLKIALMTVVRGFVHKNAY
jgi:putative colanic acid biosynthesis UDP-glucose lipid carrier transferase